MSAFIKYFQTLDTKNECKKVYADKKIIDLKNLMEGKCATWDFSKSYKHLDTEYAKLYCSGKTLQEVCPPHLEDRWESTSNKMKSFINCFNNAKISLEEHCFYDMVPEHFLLEFFEVKSRITEHVLRNYKKPHNYDFLLNLTKLTTDIKERPIKFNFNNLDSVLLSRKSNQNLIKKINNSRGNISYNVFGTRTGRLTTNSGSFPILTLKKEFRKGIEPQNDLFLEMDFNAAELRTLLALLGKEQPKEDIHEWNAENVFRGVQTRKEAKERIFAWLYNPDSKDYLANRAYDKKSIKEKYWDGKIVKTPFGREIVADDFHALNYIIQSTTSDLFLRRALAVNKMLYGRKSNIAFMIHDSLVIDFSNEDKELLKKMISMFSNTSMGSFKTNISVGKNFGALRQIL